MSSTHPRVPAVWSHKEARERGYFFSPPGFVDPLGLRPGHFPAITRWMVWHENYRDALITNCESVDVAIEWARQHEVERWRTWERGSPTAIEPSPPPGAPQGHYDGAPLAVGTVPQSAMDAARAFVEAAGTDMRHFAPHEVAKAQAQAKAENAVGRAAARAYHKRCAAAFERALAILLSHGFTDITVTDSLEHEQSVHLIASSDL